LLRAEVERLDANLPLYRVMSFGQAVRNALWNARLSDTIVRSIAIVALLLAVIGLYAVTGHTVERWTRELGLRRALGARSTEIGWLVLRRILTQLTIGIVVGVAGTYAFDRTFNQSVAQSENAIRMIDATALALIILSIVVVAIVACLVPIRRATQVDPLVALRAE
jgi:ABC-type antimicrobial peptide transport system permease subunit